MRGLGHPLEANKRACTVSLLGSDAVLGACVYQRFAIKKHSVNICISNFSPLHGHCFSPLPPSPPCKLNYSLCLFFPLFLCSFLYFSVFWQQELRQLQQDFTLAGNGNKPWTGGTGSLERGKARRTHWHIHTYPQQTHVCAHNYTFIPSKLGSYQIILYPFFFT